MIALDPVLHGDEHADHLFAADLHRPRIAVMRRAVDPGGLDQILASEHQPGALRPADVLAAAVADERRAALQVDVRNGQDLRRRVDEHRHVVRLGDVADHLGRERPAVVSRPGEDVDHRRLRADRELQRLGRIDLDDLHAHGADGGVVDVARVRRDDDLVFRETLEVRQAHVQIGIAAGDAGRRRVRHRGGAAGAHHAPLGAGELGQPLADGLHHLVQVGMLLVRGALRRPHLRQLDRSADDRQGAAAVDQRADADRLVDVGLDGRRRGAAALRRCGAGRDHRAGAEKSGEAEELAAAIRNGVRS